MVVTVAVKIWLPFASVLAVGITGPGIGGFAIEKLKRPCHWRGLAGACHLCSDGHAVAQIDTWGACYFHSGRRVQHRDIRRSSSCRPVIRISTVFCRDYMGPACGKGGVNRSIQDRRLMC